MRVYHSSMLRVLSLIVVISWFVGVLGQAPNSKEAMLAEINKFRQSFGKKAVCISPEASKLADAYAQEMISKNKLDHYADGKEPEQRYSSLPGYKSENLFQGSTLTQSDSAAIALQNGLNDHSTKANINDDSATHVGIGIAVKPEADGSLYYWVHVFVSDKPCDPEDKPKDPTIQEQIAPPKVEKQQAPATPTTPPPQPPAIPVQAMPVMMMPVQVMAPPPSPPAPAPPLPKPEIPKKDQPYIPTKEAPRAKSTPVYKPVEPQIENNPKPKTVPRTPSMPVAPPPAPPSPPPQPTCPCGPPANGAPNTPINIPEPKAPANAPALSPPPSPLANAPAQPVQASMFPVMPPPTQQAPRPIAPGSMIERTILKNNGTLPVTDGSAGQAPNLMANPAGGQVFTPAAPLRYNAAR